MAAFNRPLIALSLTEPDEGLLTYAALAARYHHWSDVHIAHILPADHSDRPCNPEPWQEKLESEVIRFFGQPNPQWQPTYHVVQGSRIDQLLRLAVQHDRDLIMLGHRRQRSGRRSLARRLAMLAPCSVWLVPEGSAARIGSILVPTDFSGHSADALEVAAMIARSAGLDQCYAAHVFFDASTIRYDEHVDEVLGREEAAFDKFLAQTDTRGVQVEPIFHESTHPPQAILRVAKNCGADLLVMNTRGRSHAASVLLGSVTSDTMAATSVPLLAVKHYGSRMTVVQALLNHRFWEQSTPKSN